MHPLSEQKNYIIIAGVKGVQGVEYDNTEGH